MTDNFYSELLQTDNLPTLHIQRIKTMANEVSKIMNKLFNILFSIELQNIRLNMSQCKTYNKTFATSEDSDQPAHPRSLIRVFTDRMYLLQPPGYLKRDRRELLLYWVGIQADLSLCWSQRSYCRFSRASFSYEAAHVWNSL